MRKRRAAAIRRAKLGPRSNSPNLQKSEWSGFLDRGKADLKACRIVDAQLSAYLAQQAIEKHAKALILKCGINIRPDRMGHFMVRSMIDELVNNQDKLLCKIVKDKELSVQQLKMVWSAIGNKLKMLETKPALKEIVFKESLGISLDEKEQKIMDECGMNLDIPDDLDILNIFNKIRHAISSKSRQVLKHRTAFANSDEIKRLAIVSFTIAALNIVTLFPHETYGRYPIAVGNKRAAQVYESHLEKLKELIDDAEKDCKLLEKVVSAIPDKSQHAIS